jgi:DNA-binding transcriptional LysR family regulator
MMPGMRYTHISKADLNLLVSFQALIEERSITRAARRMFLSQPAMSRVFDRLQELLKDELLVRTETGYKPTKRASLAYVELTQLLPRIEQLLQQTEFNPADAVERFRIAATPYASVWLVPRLVESLVQLAPNIQLDISRAHDGFQQLETNEIDLLLSTFDVPRTLRSSLLFQEPWVCLVRKNHPIGKGRLTLQKYLAAQHVSGQQALFEQNLGRLNHQRNVRARMADFFPIGVIVERTDLIATLALRTAQQLAKITNTRIVAAPVEVGNFTYSQAWHPRNDSDASHKWLRELVRSMSVHSGTERRALSKHVNMSKR